MTIKQKKKKRLYLISKVLFKPTLINTQLAMVDKVKSGQSIYLFYFLFYYLKAKKKKLRRIAHVQELIFSFLQNEDNMTQKHLLSKYFK